MSARSVSSRSSSSSSVSSRSSHSSGKSSTKYKERRLPDTPAINTLLYFTGRHPKKVKGVRVYQTTWDDGYDDRSEHSSWSASSWGSNKTKTEIYLLESRGTYWDNGYPSPSSGRASRASRKGGNRDPWGKGGGGRPAQVDDDSGSDNERSVHGFPPRPGGGPPMMGRPPPPMPGHHFPQPPPGAFQPGFGPPPQGFPGPPPGHPGGFPQRATPVPGPPPPPQQGFVRDPNGVQFFTG